MCLRATRAYERGHKMDTFSGHRVCWARDDRNTHAKLFCNQVQNYECKLVASITINLFFNISTAAVFYI